MLVTGEFDFKSFQLKQNTLLLILHFLVFLFYLFHQVIKNKHPFTFLLSSTSYDLGDKTSSLSFLSPL
jgi:hypothetical protein